LWEGVSCPPIYFHPGIIRDKGAANESTKVIILEQAGAEVRARALALFASRAKQAVGLRGEVNVRVTSNEEMRQLNQRFRRKNKPTDVLSFPSDLPEISGDIALSAEIAATNASALGHTLEAELKILILHGLLHLAGYDHESDRGEMQMREAELRQKFKLPVGLIARTHAQAAGAAYSPPKSAGRPSSVRSAGRQGRRR
jgi:probable rRNA maturation factor